jgi:hypothetical protein
MRCYTISKPPSLVNPDCIFWSKNELAKNIDPKQISSFLFITRTKEVYVIYKPTLIFNKKGDLSAIISNMLYEGSTPAIFKIDNDKVGSCYALRNNNKVSAEFHPETPLPINMVKGMDWEYATNEISLIAIPTLVPLSYGKKIENTIFDDDFVEEMQQISSKQLLGQDHGRRY